MNKLFLFLLISTITFKSNSEEFACNGYEELCNRRLNEVAFVHAHNATSNKSCPVQNQDRTIKEQLNDGIRSMKVPVHYDYENLLGYYVDALNFYISDLEQQIDSKTKDISKDYEETKNKLSNIQNNIKSLDSDIDEVQREIDSLKNKINELENKPKEIQKLALIQSIEKFNKEHSLCASNVHHLEKPLHLAISLDDIKDKFSEGTSKAKNLAEITKIKAEIVSKEAKKKALQLSRNASIKSLEGLKKIISSINPKLDPRVAALNAEKVLAEGALKVLETTIGKDKGKRVPFTCHGLAKRELYKDFIGNLDQNVPESIRPVMTKVFNFLKSATSKSVVKTFGTKEDIGGAIPFTPCFIDRGKTKLIDFLSDIREFLDSNPNEVITVMLELYSINYDHIFDDFQKSGLLKYIHTQNVEMPWPTLGEMIQSGKRVVVFVDTGGNPKYPWMHPWSDFEGWQTKWGYSSPDEFTKKEFNINNVIVRYKSLGKANNKLINITHSITPGLAGDKKMAAIVNAKGILRPRMKKIAESINHIPNFISVDFYEYPSKDVFDVVDELNGVGKYKNNPLWKPKPN